MYCTSLISKEDRTINPFEPIDTIPKNLKIKPQHNVIHIVERKHIRQKNKQFHYKNKLRNIIMQSTNIEPKTYKEKNIL